MHHGIGIFITITVLFISLQSMPALAHEKAEQKAVDASRAWLALVDGERYGESWEEAALYFRNAINKELWQQSLNAVRKPLGKVIRRTVKSKQYSTSLPGAPDGEYVVIQYETSFSNKKSALETITPMLDRDGKWRVSGYYIK